ncbi:hypothetical protein HPB50_028192 [Hyalomma asiaticum]|nr:hypothetical protein HPB50_028192 [Hyalomma asiaticum]
MAPHGGLLLTSFVVFASLRLVVRQLEAIKVRDNFGIAEGEHGNIDVAYVKERSDPASNQGVDNLTIAVAVSIPLALVVLVVRYACRKMRLGHYSSSSSTSSIRLKRKRQRCPSTSSSTNRRKLLARDKEQTSGLSVLQEDDRSSSDCGEQVELRLCSILGPEKADEDPSDKMLRPQKSSRLAA